MSCDGTEPEQLAQELGISARTLRGWLREEWPRPVTDRGARWSMLHEQVAAARRQFQPGKSRGVSSRAQQRGSIPDQGRAAQLTSERLAALLETPTRNLIDLPESVHLEFKAAARWSTLKGGKDASSEEAILKAAAGFMNAQGGVLLIGVSDSGHATGLAGDYQTMPHNRAPRDAYENWLTSLLVDKLGGAAVATCVSITFDRLGEVDVCRVEVLASSDPVYVEERQGTRFYVRLNNSSRELNVREAHDYIRRRWNGPATPAGDLGGVSPTKPSSREDPDQITPGERADADDAEKTKVTPGAQHALERDFHRAMIDVYTRAKKEAGYTATRFIQMVSTEGGLATAKRLIHASDVSDGFTELWKRNRLDLAVENYVLDPRFSDLFSDEERAIARDRLEAYGQPSGKQPRTSDAEAAEAPCLNVPQAGLGRLRHVTNRWPARLSCNRGGHVWVSKGDGPDDPRVYLRSDLLDKIVKLILMQNRNGARFILDEDGAYLADGHQLLVRFDSEC
jgi:hypothetical protein